MKPRIKKYLLFMFGNWDMIEKNAPLMDNIRDVRIIIRRHKPDTN